MIHQPSVGDASTTTATQGTGRVESLRASLSSGGVVMPSRQNNPECFGEHRFFVAEVVANQSEGTVFVLAICTACGELKSHKTIVGHPGDSTRLFLEEKRSKG